jgi:hypothetical protein
VGDVPPRALPPPLACAPSSALSLPAEWRRIVGVDAGGVPAVTSKTRRGGGGSARGQVSFCRDLFFLLPFSPTGELKYMVAVGVGYIFTVQEYFVKLLQVSFFAATGFLLPSS